MLALCGSYFHKLDQSFQSTKRVIKTLSHTGKCLEMYVSNTAFIYQVHNVLQIVCPQTVLNQNVHGTRTIWYISYIL